MNWLQALAKNTECNRACVVVTVVEVSGSAPRGLGARMVVAADNHHDTLGGGSLELEAIIHARALLMGEVNEPVISQRRFVLGNDLAQCCGGRVTLQFDCHPANDFQVHVFGAGHVAQEVARLAHRLPCQFTFHDSRDEWLGRLQACVAAETVSPKSSIKIALMTANTYASVEACAPASYFLIMTHSHATDLELVEAVLTRGDACYCGLIASRSKAARFRSILARKGFSEGELAMLTAPLGRALNTGNTPMEVAIAGMADILNERQVRLSTELKQGNIVETPEV